MRHFIMYIVANSATKLQK